MQNCENCELAALKAELASVRAGMQLLIDAREQQRDAHRAEISMIEQKHASLAHHLYEDLLTVLSEHGVMAAR